MKCIKIKSVKNMFLLVLVIVLALVSCSKGTELEELAIENVMNADDATDLFVVDSISKRVSPTAPPAFIQIYYHVRYDLMNDTTNISKIVVYKNGVEYYLLTTNGVNTYHPRDYAVSAGHSYTYTFAFKDREGNVSKMSSPHAIPFP